MAKNMMQLKSNGFTQGIDFLLKQDRSSQLDVGINIERRGDCWTTDVQREHCKTGPCSNFSLSTFRIGSSRHHRAAIICTIRVFCRYSAWNLSWKCIDSAVSVKTAVKATRQSKGALTRSDLYKLFFEVLILYLLFVLPEIFFPPCWVRETKTVSVLFIWAHTEQCPDEWFTHNWVSNMFFFSFYRSFYWFCWIIGWYWSVLLLRQICQTLCKKELQ